MLCQENEGWPLECQMNFHGPMANGRQEPLGWNPRRFPGFSDRLSWNHKVIEGNPRDDSGAK
jgi:hypothetical protein